MQKSKNVQKLMSRMFSLGRAINRQYFEKSRSKNRLSALQIETMRFISEKREVTMKDLANYLIITPPSGTSLVDDLIKAKFVARAEDKKDRRIILIRLTKKGKSALKSYLKMKMEAMGKIMGKLKASEIKVLLRILEKLTK